MWRVNKFVRQKKLSGKTYSYAPTEHSGFWIIALKQETKKQRLQLCELYPSLQLWRNINWQEVAKIEYKI